MWNRKCRNNPSCLLVLMNGADEGVSLLMLTAETVELGGFAPTTFLRFVREGAGRQGAGPVGRGAWSVEGRVGRDSA